MITATQSEHGQSTTVGDPDHSKPPSESRPLPLSGGRAARPGPGPAGARWAAGPAPHARPTRFRATSGPAGAARAPVVKTGPMVGLLRLIIIGSFVVTVVSIPYVIKKYSENLQGLQRSNGFKSIHGSEQVSSFEEFKTKVWQGGNF
jgi:hypothetical protein